MKNLFAAFFLSITVLYGTILPTVVLAANPSTEPSSAVPPVIVLHDEKGDYVVDEPFPQWVREAATSKSGNIIASCSAANGLMPSWADPLPVEPVKCAALNADKKELWAATNNGLIFLDLENRRKLYFAGRRWLPDNDVISVGVYADGNALAHTTKGDSVIARRMMTLEQKALYFDRIAQERHNRDGMMSDAPLRVPGDVKTSFLTDDDNDGQWTEMYIAAESFRYAVTGDQEAKRNARESFLAMEKLLTVTPVKGYVARSVLPADTCIGKDPEQWRKTASGDICWKTDTSKDELVGHYLGLPIYYDLVADESEKETIKTLIRDLTDYIVGNGFRLLNEKGNVTTYGNLDPEWINGPYGKMGDQGLNSALALAMVRSAYNITGDEKYLDSYKLLIDKHHYQSNVKRTKEISDRYQVNHDSDEMAALSFYSLIRAENSDAKLRDDYYLEGMRRLWEKDLKERNAEQIIIYGAFAAKDYRLDLAVRSLREIPLDLLYWGINNSSRKDITASQKLDRFNRLQGLTVLPYTEIRTVRWSRNLYQLDEEENGGSESIPTFWLLNYWMARYHGMIRPGSATND
ncbi:MAG: hypothetical protein WCX65_10155 [bacterium]